MTEQLQPQIASHLSRIGAEELEVRHDSEFAPDVGTLLHVTIDGAEWRFLPDHFLQLLELVPDDGGPEAVKRSIEENAVFVWHGDYPDQSTER